MPIEVQVNATVSEVVRTTLPCNRLYVTRLEVDASGLAQRNPSGSMSVLPYAADANDQPTAFADASNAITVATADIFAAAANLPQINAVIGAVFALGKAWYDYRVKRLAELDVAKGQLATAQAALDAMDQDNPDAALADAVTQAQATCDAASRAASDPMFPPVTALAQA